MATPEKHSFQRISQPLKPQAEQHNHNQTCHFDRVGTVAVAEYPFNKRFTKFAFLVLAWNLAVVLWGAFVRATGSGAGCGNHWPLCNGDVVPRSPATETIIEFTHRITSGLALIGVIVLLLWALRRFPAHHAVRRFAGLSLVFIVLEALLGAGLVLLQYVEKNASVGRAFYLSAHLANTQLLLGVLALAAWFSGGTEVPRRLKSTPHLWVLPAALVVSISGAIAALGDTLFPATSFAEGMRQEISDSAHFLLRLRVLHPALAVVFAAGVSFLAIFIIRQKLSAAVTRLAWYAWLTTGIQLVAGAINVLLLAPVWMQLLHLLLADVLWILLVLLVAEAASSRTIEVEAVNHESVNL